MRAACQARRTGLMVRRLTDSARRMAPLGVPAPAARRANGTARRRAAIVRTVVIAMTMTTMTANRYRSGGRRPGLP